MAASAITVRFARIKVNKFMSRILFCTMLFERFGTTLFLNEAAILNIFSGKSCRKIFWKFY